ncbi:hypothetical protein F8B43_3510 [Methylorubrum populi]|uniref:Uncharacterized protein n=1 Tax=Methylorubrum populi TaxID=223967 RepID=A0A833J4P5_9HYPH|nr:hypothetical protein F8B43_3510 [Methylorubrum populi]
MQPARESRGGSARRNLSRLAALGLACGPVLVWSPQRTERAFP